VIIAPLLPDWTPVTLPVHSSPNPQDHDAVRTRMKPFSPEEPGLNPPASSRGHGDESDSDCQIQIQEGPEPDTSSVERQEQRPQVPASDGPGQPRGTRQAQSREEETLQPPRTQPWRDLEWQQTLQVGTGLNNLNNTCFCSAVLQCLTHTAPLTKFCLDRGHSMRLGNAAATEEYDAFLAVERHVAEAFGSRQSSIAPTFNGCRDPATMSY
jgi:hypothetical protein